MKFSLYIFICFCFLMISCRQESKSKHITIKTDIGVADTAQLKSLQTFTLLQTGPLLPPLYENVQDIVSEKYNVYFVWAGGCIINKKLQDSIESFNTNTENQLNKFYKRDVVTEINNYLGAEYKYLMHLDDYLRKTQKKLNNLILIYYAKKQKTYKAYYLFGMPTEKTLQYRIKTVMEIDSASMNSIYQKQKDETQPYNLKELQND